MRAAQSSMLNLPACMLPACRSVYLSMQHLLSQASLTAGVAARR